MVKILKLFLLFNLKINVMEEICFQLSLKIVKFCLQSNTFFLKFFPIFTCVDPDPYSK